MKRKDLLLSELSEDKNVTTVVAATLLKDIKFLKREKRNLEDKIEDAEESLKLRLSSNAVVDASTVVVAYAAIITLKGELALYEAFEAEYITDEK
jgi:hypothetical protein